MMYVMIMFIGMSYAAYGVVTEDSVRGATVMGNVTHEAPSLSKKKQTINRVWSDSAVLELNDMLQITQDDVFAIIHNDIDLVIQLYHGTPAHLTLAVIADQKKCSDAQKRIADTLSNRRRVADNVKDAIDEELPEKLIQVLCGKPETISLDGATVLYIALPENISDKVVEKISQRIADMPDGIRIASTVSLAELPSLRLERTQSILPTVAEEILLYVYLVKRPTPAELLEALYCGVNGFSISSSETDVICKSGGNATYGEILFDSAEKLFTEILPLTENDVVVDLGSGVGKLVLWLYLATPAKESIGIELSKSRVTASKDMMQKVQQELVPQLKDKWVEQWGAQALKKKVSFRHENILESDLSNVTVIFVCATCFPESCMQALSEKFATLHEGLRIATLKELPHNPSLKKIGSHRLPMTWSRQNGSEVMIYVVEQPRLRDVIPLVIEQASSEKPGECPVKTDEKKSNLQADYLELSSLEEVWKALKIDTSTVFVHVGMQDGSTVLHAYLEEDAPAVLGVALSSSVYRYAERLKKAVSEWLEEEPYKKLWKDEWGAKGDMRTISFFDASLKEDELIADISNKASGKKLALLMTVRSDDTGTWKRISDQCAALPEGTRIAVWQPLEKNDRLELQETLKLCVKGEDSGLDGARPLKEYFVYEIKPVIKAAPVSTQQVSKGKEAKKIKKA